MSPAAKRVVLDGVSQILDSLDTPDTRKRGRQKPRKHEPTFTVKAGVVRAVDEAVDAIIDAINDGRRALGPRGAPPISSDVRRAWHVAASLLFDALGENGAVLQKQRRMRPIKPPPPLPKKPSSMSEASWLADCEGRADATIRILRSGRGGPFAKWTETDWQRERGRIVRVYLTGDRDS